MAFPRTPAVLGVVSALVVSCGNNAAPPQNSTSTKVSTVTAAPVPPNCAEPAAVPALLSLQDSLGQLLMVGVKNADDARTVVANHHVGGIFIGSWTDMAIFDGPLAEISDNAGPLPLSVSIDEEGGRVSRLKNKIGPAPSAKELAKNKTADEVYKFELDRGRKIHDLGITIDFAPVVDVVADSTADDTVIGDRSFGSDPAKVTEYAGAYAKGLREAGLLPVLKHFPGHGHGSGDSHTGGVATPPLSDLVDKDLVPYRTLVTETPVAVMIGHLQVPDLTGDQPASLSSKAVALLRTGKDYGGPPFDGPIFSDDLSGMAAISAQMGVAEAALKTLQAGIDVALWITTDEVPAVLDRLQKAVFSNELPMSRVNEAVLHVAKMKGKSPKCPH